MYYLTLYYTDQKRCKPRLMHHIFDKVFLQSCLYAIQILFNILCSLFSAVFRDRRLSNFTIKSLIKPKKAVKVGQRSNRGRNVLATEEAEPGP